MRGGQHKPWHKEDLPAEWVEKFYDGWGCALLNLSGGAPPENDEELFCARVLHFMHTHRWYRLIDLIKGLKTSSDRVTGLLNKYQFICSE